MFILSMWSLSRKLYYLFTYIKKIIVDWLYKTPGDGTHQAHIIFLRGGGNGLPPPTPETALGFMIDGFTGRKEF